MYKLNNIRAKLQEWKDYYDKAPKVPYKGNEEVWDTYRSTHDRDCVLMNGDLNADTIISLWLPLRAVLVAINGEEFLEGRGKYQMCDFLLQDDNLTKFLPPDNLLVFMTENLFDLGMGVENVMLLPERWVNSASGLSPYYDYIPYFLWEGLEGERFHGVWKDAEAFRQWIVEQKLQMAFEDEILDVDHIIDMNGSGDVKHTAVAKDEDAVLEMLVNYKIFLMYRKARIKAEERDEVYREYLKVGP